MVWCQCQAHHNWILNWLKFSITNRWTCDPLKLFNEIKSVIEWVVFHQIYCLACAANAMDTKNWPCLNKFEEGKSRYKITFDTWQLFLAQKIFLLNHISKGVSDFNLIKSGTKNYTCPYWSGEHNPFNQHSVLSCVSTKNHSLPAVHVHFNYQ